ncbi:hypothetical protein MRX96_059746 [Rhipicephalus microplus]
MRRGVTVSRMDMPGRELHEKVSLTRFLRDNPATPLRPSRLLEGASRALRSTAATIEGVGVVLHADVAVVVVAGVVAVTTTATATATVATHTSVAKPQDTMSSLCRRRCPFSSSSTCPDAVADRGLGLAPLHERRLGLAI